jgi:hypothetical protein
MTPFRQNFIIYIITNIVIRVANRETIFIKKYINILIKLKQDKESIILFIKNV